MMEAAHFPYQGRMVDPRIDDYLTELGFLEEAVRFRRGNPYAIVRWRRMIRRLGWAASVSKTAPDKRNSG